MNTQDDNAKVARILMNILTGIVWVAFIYFAFRLIDDLSKPENVQ